jgi:hypothetical protein
MIKTLVIGCYIAHKIYWKKTHKERTIKWVRFFPVKENV